MGVLTTVSAAVPVESLHLGTNQLFPLMSWEMSPTLQQQLYLGLRYLGGLQLTLNMSSALNDWASIGA